MLYTVGNEKEMAGTSVQLTACTYGKKPDVIVLKGSSGNT
jgi:hypothetical protein